MFATSRCSACCSSRPAALGHATTSSLRLLPKRSRATRHVTNSFAPSSMDVVTTVSQIVTTATIAVGTWWMLNRELAPQQDRYEQRNSTPCPVCSGTGFETCLCTRWSDGDYGCSTCSKTGYMRCRACSGGGTAVPLAMKIRK